MNLQPLTNYLRTPGHWLLFLLGFSVVLSHPLPRYFEHGDSEAAATGHRGPARTQFHEQGIQGPRSYRFGYDTADPDNRQTRYEVSDGHGVVRGHYTFLDHYGKERTVHYMAHPKYGFRAKGHFGEFPRP